MLPLINVDLSNRNIVVSVNCTSGDVETATHFSCLTVQDSSDKVYISGILLVDCTTKCLLFGKGVLKLDNMKVLRRSPDLLNNVKIGQGQLQLIMKYILFFHI